MSWLIGQWLRMIFRKDRHSFALCAVVPFPSRVPSASTRTHAPSMPGASERWKRLRGSIQGWNLSGIFLIATGHLRTGKPSDFAEGPVRHPTKSPKREFLTLEKSADALLEVLGRWSTVTSGPRGMVPRTSPRRQADPSARPAAACRPARADAPTCCSWSPDRSGCTDWGG
jgi:hypothetical protein